MFKLEINTGGAPFGDESKADRNGDYELDSLRNEVRRILDEVSRCGADMSPVSSWILTEIR